nr:hypothetical protein [Tanacetum cinerariifolium]
MVGKDSLSFIGASGGIMSIWNSSVSCVEQKLVDRNYLAILGRWSGISRSVGFVNVYAPQANADKEVLWAFLDVLINSLDAIWVIFGDFNAVRSREERMECIFDDAEAYSFCDFITRVGLIDLPLGGRRFTRFDEGGKKASKLDRFLISHSFLDEWKDAF